MEKVRNYDTLMACLPNESKEILYGNGIIAPTSTTSKPPLFNYVTFIKDLEINTLFRNVFKNYKSKVVAQEIYKMFMNQISSLRELSFHYKTVKLVSDISFAIYPGAKNCLKNLSTLSCGSNVVYPEFFLN